mmetsp:Transcript_265/g.600  ORF Transcript_265/g.600 Transcript_265/m.600 type:complete len:120 (-) Transcript_265:37-396(-)
MLANIDKAEVLENKAAELSSQAKMFHKTARDTKRAMCKQNAKMNLLLACICLVIILAVSIPIITQCASEKPPEFLSCTIALDVPTLRCSMLMPPFALPYFHHRHPLGQVRRWRWRQQFA